MKNILSRLSREIHPGYFEYAVESQPGLSQSNLRSKWPSLGQLVHVTELFSLLTVSTLAVYSFHSMGRQALPSFSSSAPVNESTDIEKRLELVGQILDYLVKKVDVPSPVASSVETQPAKTCRINVSKAFLRIGPGRNFSPLMSLAQNSELLVEDESAEWLQVIAPTGQKAWVSRRVVSL